MMQKVVLHSQDFGSVRVALEHCTKQIIGQVFGVDEPHVARMSEVQVSE